MSPTYISRAGLQKLQDEQRELVRQKVRLTEEVSKAAAMGDLRENAEYHAARERLQHVAGRLAEIIAKLSEVVITDDLEVAEGEVRVGSTVVLEDQQTKEEIEYLLVGPDEADPVSGKLSLASPLAKQMLGKKEGDNFVLKLPSAVVPYKVVSVRRD